MQEILITSSVLIGVILLIRWLFRGKVGQKLIYAAWLLVALRLLIPVQFGQLQFSVLTAAKPMTQVITQISDQQVAGVTDKEAYQQILEDYVENNRGAFTPQMQVQIQSAIKDDLSADEIAQMIIQVSPDEDIFLPEKQAGVQQQVAQNAAPITLGQIFGVIWILGIAAMAAWFVIVNLRHSRSLRAGAEKLDCDSPLPVYVTQQADSPCLVGLFKPAIYLTPESVDSPERLQHILTHELTHYAHWDHIWSLVRCLCLCIYWFDPLVWIAAHISRQDCEMACDEGALKRLGEESRLDYGKTLLCVVTQASAPGRLLQTATSMNETKKQLKERISFIAHRRKISVIATICLLLVCAITAGCAAAGPIAEPASPPQQNSWEISEETKAQMRQDYVEYLAYSNHTCTAEDVNLAVVSHVESGYVLLIGCKCGSINLDPSWTNLWSTIIGDYEFFMPREWFMQFYADGTFSMLDAAFNLERITKEEIADVWSDYYIQFPAAWSYYKQRYPDDTPNRQEANMLEQYREIVEFLNEYDLTESRSNSIVDYETFQTYRSQAAIRFCYEWLQKTTEVDKWVDYCEQHWAGYEYDRKTILNNFTVIEDVRLQAVLYNSNFKGIHSWHYDDQGRLYYEQLDMHNPFTMQQYIPKDFQSGMDYMLYYDESGKISQIGGQHGYYTYTPNYDQAGKISSMTVQFDESARLIQYTYDDADRLIRVEIAGSTLLSSNYLIEYTYDADGNLTRSVQTYRATDPYDPTHTKVYVSCQKIIEYSYDNHNVLQEAVYIEKRFQNGATLETQDKYTFSYDKHGRMVRYDIAYDDQQQTTGYVEITYGDFLYYAG